MHRLQHTSSWTFFFLAIGAAPVLKLPLVEQVALKHRPIPGDEAPPRVLGYLLGGTGVVQDDLRQHIVRPAAHPEVQVVLDLPRQYRGVRPLGGEYQMNPKGPSQPRQGGQLVFNLPQPLLAFLFSIVF